MMPERTDSDRLRSIESDLYAVRAEVARLRARTPGFFSRVCSGALAHLAGLILYSVVGVVVTILAWSTIIATLTAAAVDVARREMDRTSGQPPAQRAPSRSEASPR